MAIFNSFFVCLPEGTQLQGRHSGRNKFVVSHDVSPRPHHFPSDFALSSARRRGATGGEMCVEFRTFRHQDIDFYLEEIWIFYDLLMCS
jgi:hypothetical protein